MMAHRPKYSPAQVRQLKEDYLEALKQSRLRVFLRRSLCFQLQKMCICLLQKAHLEFDNLAVIDLPWIPLRFSFEIIIRQKTFFL